MYSKNQEKIIFYIVMFTLVAFQAFSTVVLCKKEYFSLSHICLAVLNAALFFGMILYAKWVWRGLTVFKALLKIITFQFFIVAVVLCPILLLVWLAG